MADDERSDQRDKERAEGEREAVESAIETDASGKPVRADVPRAGRQGSANEPLPEEQEAQERTAK